MSGRRPSQLLPPWQSARVPCPAPRPGELMGRYRVVAVRVHGVDHLFRDLSRLQCDLDLVLVELPIAVEVNRPPEVLEDGPSERHRHRWERRRRLPLELRLVAVVVDPADEVGVLRQAANRLRHLLHRLHQRVHGHHAAGGLASLLRSSQDLVLVRRDVEDHEPHAREVLPEGPEVVPVPVHVAQAAVEDHVQALAQCFVPEDLSYAARFLLRHVASGFPVHLDIGIPLWQHCADLVRVDDHEMLQIQHLVLVHPMLDVALANSHGASHEDNPGQQLVGGPLLSILSAQALDDVILHPFSLFRVLDVVGVVQ
mmetsp:Transcript_91558/g.259228  ORF Transcript_91558/g.259228 Transcript_91558/m.259228 type:complete len:312 (-) Transcript_91558:253-1188(-)